MIDNARNTSLKIVSYVNIPDPHDRPAKFRQLHICQFVALLSSDNLLSPVLGGRPIGIPIVRMSVPEHAIYEHRHTPAHKGNIWPTRDIPAVHSIARGADCAQSSAQSQLRLRVL